MDVKNFIINLETAKLYGIQSIKQLILFMEISNRIDSSKEDFNLVDLTQCDASDPYYKEVASTFLKLSIGEKSRGRDGLGLVCYQKKLGRKSISLTSKGLELFDLLKNGKK